MSFRFFYFELFVTLILINLNSAASQADLPSDSFEERQEFKLEVKVKPTRTIADTAEEYWIANDCIYPPKAFFGLFREACEVKLKAQTFYSGICQAFFNSSKQLCKLEGANEDDVQTMLSIRDMQETIDDDALCDTIAEIKLNKPQLFPSAKSEKEKWFESISSFVFSPETCSNACSMKGLHPICFGYMLNYNYLGNPHSFVMSDVGKDNGDNDNNADGEKDLGKSDDFITDGLDNSRNEIDDHANEMDLVINQNSSDKADVKDNQDLNQKATVDFSEIFNENPDELANLLALDTAFMKNKEVPSVIDDFDDFEPDFQVKPFREMENPNQEIPLFYRGARPRLRGYYREGMDGREEEPMLGAILMISCLLAIICFVVLFGIRKKIGFYVRRLHNNRRNNWNYERVFAVQPDDDDYYE